MLPMTISRVEGVYRFVEVSIHTKAFSFPFEDDTRPSLVEMYWVDLEEEAMPGPRVNAEDEGSGTASPGKTSV